MNYHPPAGFLARRCLSLGKEPLLQISWLLCWRASFTQVLPRKAAGSCKGLGKGMQSSTATKTTEDAQPERSDTEMLSLSQTPVGTRTSALCTAACQDHGHKPTGAHNPKTSSSPGASPKGRAKGCSHSHTKAAPDPLRESFFKGTI